LLAEDEICGTLDQAFGIYLSTGLGENGVLEAQELDTVVALFVCISRHGKRLRTRSPSVRKVDVVDLKVGGPGTESGSQVIVGDVVLAELLRNGDLVSGIACGVGGITVDG
jgi:hypothetical protein